MSGSGTSTWTSGSGIWIVDLGRRHPNGDDRLRNADRHLRRLLMHGDLRLRLLDREPCRHLGLGFGRLLALRPRLACIRLVCCSRLVGLLLTLPGRRPAGPAAACMPAGPGLRCRALAAAAPWPGSSPWAGSLLGLRRRIVLRLVVALCLLRRAPWAAVAALGLAGAAPLPVSVCMSWSSSAETRSQPCSSPLSASVRAPSITN